MFGIGLVRRVATAKYRGFHDISRLPSWISLCSKEFRTYGWGEENGLGWRVTCGVVRGIDETVCNRPRVYANGGPSQVTCSKTGQMSVFASFQTPISSAVEALLIEWVYREIIARADFA